MNSPTPLQPDTPSEFNLVELEAKEGLESFRWLATQLLQVVPLLVLGYHWQLF